MNAPPPPRHFLLQSPASFKRTAAPRMVVDVAVLEDLKSAPEYEPNFSGSWYKNKRASDMECYSKQLDMLEITGIKKATAMKLINGVEIEHTPAGLRSAFRVDKVPFFRQVENFAFGRETSMERRDKRGGQQVGTVKRVPKGLEVDIRFSAPNPGSIKEIYTFAGEDTLQIESIVDVQGKVIGCKQVYRKL